ncbi:MAG: type II secretion system F family protein [Candidatus Firestonebacteria bacterium]|nr:type II secretion system F family protein [Candidatus Firestonebacteria bacterium]
MMLKGRSFIYLSIAIFFVFLFFFNLLCAFVAAALTFGFPKYLNYKKQRLIKEKFTAQLLEGVELIAGSLRSGMTFQQAVAYLVKELPQPLAGEFKELQDKIMLGSSVENSLLDLSQKHKDNSLDLLVTSVIISRETGGNLAEVLSKVSLNMRENAGLEGQIKTLTAQGKLSGLIVGALPFVLLIFLYFIDRELILPMFTTLPGMALLILALIMELTGALIIKKITDIEY